jgi:hypothetical protein
MDAKLKCAPSTAPARSNDRDVIRARNRPVEVTALVHLVERRLQHEAEEQCAQPSAPSSGFLGRRCERRRGTPRHSDHSRAARGRAGTSRRQSRCRAKHSVVLVRGQETLCHNGALPSRQRPSRVGDCSACCVTRAAGLCKALRGRWGAPKSWIQLVRNFCQSSG